MNVFKTLEGKEYDLTVDNYLEYSHKSKPYFQDEKRYKCPRFAICPMCNNPIQIINLYKNDYVEEVTGRKGLHARHFAKNIEGLAEYNESRYESCPLHKPVNFKLIEVRHNEEANEEIKKFVEMNSKRIMDDIRNITGIFFKYVNLEEKISNYIKKKNYAYTHTNRFNIPYSILYTSEAFDIYGRKMNENEMGKKIEYAIWHKSKYFTVQAAQIKRKVADYANIRLLVTKHIVHDSGEQTMLITIEEEMNRQVNVILKERILLEQFLYT
jgi:hypothetical protein